MGKKCNSGLVAWLVVRGMVGVERRAARMASARVGQVPFIRNVSQFLRLTSHSTKELTWTMRVEHEKSGH